MEKAVLCLSPHPPRPIPLACDLKPFQRYSKKDLAASGIMRMLCKRLSVHGDIGMFPSCTLIPHMQLICSSSTRWNWIGMGGVLNRLGYSQGSGICFIGSITPLRKMKDQSCSNWGVVFNI